MRISCPDCRADIKLPSGKTPAELVCPDCKTRVQVLDLLTLPPTSGLPDTVDSESQDWGTAEPLMPGMELAQFRLIRMLGRGGFGTVFEAYDSRLDRHVAIKIPNQKLFTPEQAEVFIREARAAAQLQDPRIVSVFEVGRKSGQLYIVSELIKGQTLRKWFATQPGNPKIAATLVAQLARAMHKAHLRGIVHRDLKPGNILVDQDGNPHITDFGLAKRIDSEEQSVARDGDIIGTPTYMSPEQARGAGHTADHRSDIYSLGVILFELFTGQRLYSADSQSKLLDEIRQGMRSEIADALRPLGLDAAAICSRALALDPNERYPSAKALADDLECWVDRKPVSARALGPLDRTRYFLRRHWLTVSLLALASVTAGVAAAGWLRQQQPLPLAEKKTEVEIDVTPNDAIVTWVPVEPDHRGLNEQRAVTLTPDRNGTCIAELPAALYLLRVQTPERVHEVYRLVPRNRDEMRELGYRVTEWQFNAQSQRIELAAVKANSIDTAEDGLFRLGPVSMVRIAGGSFLGGTESISTFRPDRSRSSPLFPVQQYTVNEYFLSQREISANEYRQVMDRYPQGMNLADDATVDDSVTAHSVSWLEAVEFAERVGGRLPTFLEHQFAATNAGSTRFPWGDDARNRFGAINDAGDRTLHPVPVEGLFSGVGEWLWDSRFVMFPKSDSVLPMRMSDNAGPNSRLVAGLPLNSLNSKISLSDSDDPGNLISRHRSDRNDRIGFRIAFSR